MSNGTAIPELDAGGLRRFGLTTGLILAALFGLFFPWCLEKSIPVWPWAVAGTLMAWALIAPASLRGVYVAWMKLGLLLGKIVSPIVLGVIFFVTIVPPAIIMKIIRRDPLHRDFDSRVDTYRVPSRKAPPENLKRPF